VSGLVLSDAQRKIALLVKRRKTKVEIIRLAAGKLSIDTLADAALRKEFSELDYPFEQALDKFLSHGAAHGMTDAARVTLESLALEQRTQARLF
jgi:hypothetical protein